ncbi:MAG: HNH endonuclease [Desulfosudaceae bacterium]
MGKRPPGSPIDPEAPWGGLVDPADIRREKNKARELRQTQWWKRRLSRGRCYYCGREFPPAELTMDHVVPLARGGKTTKGNVVPACKTCNTEKKQRLPVEWEAYLERLHKGEG